MDFRVNQENIIIVRWFDNKAVNLLSSYVGIEPTGSVKRWDRKTKTHIMVPRPAIVEAYNKFMGGVDLLDMLSALYKFSFQSRRLECTSTFGGTLSQWQLSMHGTSTEETRRNWSPGKNPWPCGGFRLLLALPLQVQQRAKSSVADHYPLQIRTQHPLEKAKLQCAC